MSVVDGPEVTEQIKKAVGSGRIPLALDGVSGPATGVLASLLAPGGTLVAYSAMSGSPMILNPLVVIYTPITLKGFFMGHAQWQRKIPAAIEEAATLVVDGVKVPIAAVYRLATRVREKPSNPRTYPTFTLPRGVALNTR